MSCKLLGAKAYHSASVLELLISGIVLLLLSNISVFKVGEGLEESVKGVTGLEFEPDGVEQGSAEGGLVDLLDRGNDIGLSGRDQGDER